MDSDCTRHGHRAGRGHRDVDEGVGATDPNPTIRLHEAMNRKPTGLQRRCSIGDQLESIWVGRLGKLKRGRVVGKKRAELQEHSLGIERIGNREERGAVGQHASDPANRCSIDLDGAVGVTEAGDLAVRPCPARIADARFLLVGDELAGAMTAAAFDGPGHDFACTLEALRFRELAVVDRHGLEAAHGHADAGELGRGNRGDQLVESRAPVQDLTRIPDLADVPKDDPVRAASSIDVVSAWPRDDRVVAGIAATHVIPSTADDLVVSRPAVKRVVSPFPENAVVPTPAMGHVVATATLDRIITAAAVDVVIAWTAEDGIRRRVALAGIVSVATNEEVSGGTSAERVIFTEANQTLRGATTDQYVRSRVPLDYGPTGRAARAIVAARKRRIRDLTRKHVLDIDRCVVEVAAADGAIVRHPSVDVVNGARNLTCEDEERERERERGDPERLMNRHRYSHGSGLPRANGTKGAIILSP